MSTDYLKPGNIAAWLRELSAASDVEMKRIEDAGASPMTCLSMVFTGTKLDMAAEYIERAMQRGALPSHYEGRILDGVFTPAKSDVHSAERAHANDSAERARDGGSEVVR